jgi:hypothetical protein
LPVKIYEEPTEYKVCCLPLDRKGAYHFTITVAWRGNDRWAVINSYGYCLGTDGQWDYEPSNSNREDDWLETHRYELDEALKLARREAPNAKVMGYTVEDALTGEFR